MPSLREAIDPTPALYTQVREKYLKEKCTGTKTRTKAVALEFQCTSAVTGSLLKPSFLGPPSVVC